MDKEKLLGYVAPCSLLCYTCMGYKDGAIAECARRLHAYNEGVCEFRGAHMPEEEREAWHAFFREFHGTLRIFSQAACPGCRSGTLSGSGCIEGCPIPSCAKSRGIDFCAECDEFPCKRAKDFFDGYDAKITPVWENGNSRIRAVGVDAYFEEKKDVSHYLHYKE